MRKLVIALVTASIGCLAESPVQSTLEDFRAHPWRMPATSAAPAKAETTTSPAQAVTSAPSAAPTATPAKNAVPSKAKWEIQLGSLSSEDAAQKRKEELEASTGPGVRVVALEGTWKLRWGSFPDKKAATKARDELKKKGIDGFPVEP